MSELKAGKSEPLFFTGSRILQLGSLRQLILASFFVALIPLIALLWQSQSDLARVGKLTVTETQFVVNLVNDMKRLDGTAVILERALRQYRVIQNDKVAELADNALNRFDDVSDSLCEAIEYGSHCDSVDKNLIELKMFRQLDDELLLNAYIASINEQVIALRSQVDKVIQTRLSTQQADLAAMQAKQAWLTALLVTISLLLILAGSQLIVNPVRKIKVLIRMLARQQGKLPPISRRAPRELAGVEKDLHWLGDRLAQLEHIRTALLRHAAHELKTPLASIKEGCSLLDDGAVGKLTQPQHEVLSLLIVSTQRLNTLIEKLLDYNLLLQQAQPTFSEVKTQEMVDDCLQDYRLALQHHELEVDVKADPIWADAELLRRILDNLVSNAVAHGARNRPINIKLYVKGEMACVEVANRGKKIPPEKVDTLFEPFTRGDGERNDNVIGTGLGLSIVADCARLMHGEVDVVDVDYADVCFRVMIPQEDAM